MPVALKKQLQSIMDDGFVLRKNTFGKCLELFPKSEFERELRRIKKLNRYNPENERFIDFFMNGSKNLELDGTGRVLIQKDLLAYAELKKDVVIASSLNMFKIWDKTNYENSMNITAEQFAELAQKVMANVPYDNED